jgi:hypothetical protein
VSVGFSCDPITAGITVSSINTQRLCVAVRASCLNSLVAVLTTGHQRTDLFRSPRHPIRKRGGTNTSIGRTTGKLTAILASCQIATVACVFTTDPESERTDIEEVCAVQGQWLSQIGPGNHVLPGPANFALLHDSRQGHWILDAADCGLREVKLPSPRAREIIAPRELTDDAVLYAVMGDPPERYGLLNLSTGREIAGALPQTGEGGSPGVHFSFDGTVGAWMEDGSDNSRDTVHIAEVGRLESAIVFAPGQRLGLDEYYLIDVVARGKAVLLERWRGGYLLVDSSGDLIRTFSLDEGVRPLQGSLRLSERGDYVAWDGYRESGRYAVQWRINGQLVRKELAPRSRLETAAVSSDWKWIAVSSSASSRGGGGVDSVTVWSRDGTTKYHRRFSRVTRASVVFLGEHLFAHPEIDDEGQATTRVFRLPD